MAEHEDLPYIVIERRSGAAVPFLWGALIGAGVVLFWAPRTGQETQEELREAVARIRDVAGERVGDARDVVLGAVDEVRQRVQDQVDAVRDAVETRVDGVRHAMESGRDAAREARDDLERRVADAKRGVASAAADATPAPSGMSAPVDVDIVVTEVVVEEPTRRNDLG